MATETNPYSGAYGRAATRTSAPPYSAPAGQQWVRGANGEWTLLPAASSRSGGPQMSPDGKSVWNDAVGGYVPATRETQAFAQAVSSGDGGLKAQQQGVANMLLAGANAANGYTVDRFSASGAPAVMNREWMQRFLAPLTNVANHAGGQDNPLTWMSDPNSGDRVAFVDKYYPQLLDELFGSNPEWKAKLDQVRVGNGPVEVDPASPGLPEGWTPPPGSTQAGADKKSGTITDLRQQLQPGQNAPAPPGRQTMQKLRNKAASLTDQQRRNRVDVLAKRIQDGTALDPAAAMRKINAFQSASIKQAIGPVSAKNKKIFNQVRQARAQGKPVNPAQAKKAAAIKKYRQNQYTKKTGNALVQTGYTKPAPVLPPSQNFNGIAGLGAALAQAIAAGKATPAGQNNNFNNLAGLAAFQKPKG